MLAQYELVNPPTDAISAIQFAPTSLRLLVASWDKHVYLYDTSRNAQIDKFEHRAPVLDVCWGANDEEAYTGGLDWDVRRYFSAAYRIANIWLINTTESILKQAPKRSCLRIPMA